MRIALIVTLLVGLSCSAQNKHNIWYFGKNAGIEFTDSGAVAVTDGAINTHEGCASISDEQGNLLLYSDGSSLYKGNHRYIGAGLGEDLGSTQSSLIVPSPGDPTQYYIFSLGGNGGSAYYSLVDLYTNKGAGSIVVHSKLFLNLSTEKITAIQHKNGKDFWIVVHKWESDEYCSFLLTEKGMSHTPVISKTGKHHGGVTGNAGGYLKSSPKGDYIVSCIRDDRLFEIFSFDNAKGKLKNLVSAQLSFFGYGVEFSPDGSKVYASIANPTSSESGGGVVQIKMDKAKFKKGILDYVKVGSSETKFVAALQLGPDGKIYVARFGSAHVGVIEHPNLPGESCSYIDDGLHLAGKECLLGLPNYTETSLNKK